MAAFVLIPGAGAGAWLWNRVAPALRTAGHEALPLTLTGLGDRVHLARPDVDLETHITDVVNAIRYADLTEVVLVGQSYGGMLLPAVAERCPEQVARLVNLDGLAPLDGESVAAIRPEFYDWMASAGGWLSAALTPEITREIDPDLTEAQADWVTGKATPQSLATFEQPLRLDRGEPSLPKTYLLCRKSWEGEPYPIDLARVMADPSWEVVELDAYHIAPISRPELVTQALLERIAQPARN